MRTLLTALLLASLATTPATAAPIVFTDRAAFDAAVGDHLLITLDNTPEVIYNDIAQIYRMTYDSIFQYGGDRSSVRFGPDGVWFGYTDGAQGAITLQPVTAIGFDVTPYPPNLWRDADLVPLLAPRAFVNGIEVTEPQFLGWRFDEPTGFGIGTQSFAVEGPDGPIPAWSVFTIDNVAIRATPVPEPGLTALALLGAGGLGAARWLARRRR